MNGSHSSGNKEHGSDMEESKYDDRLCKTLHDQISKEILEVRLLGTTHDKILRGGNGDGTGICAQIKTNTQTIATHGKIIEDWQKQFRSMNIKTWFMVLAFLFALLKDYIHSLVK